MGKHTAGQAHGEVRWRWVGERGVQVATGGATLARYESLISMNLTDVEDIIPADDSILVILKRAAAVPRELEAALTEALPEPDGGTSRRSVHELVVEYGGPDGPDLAELAERAGMTIAAYVECHAAAEYTVAFLGFQPGFPYLRGLPDELHAERRASPRQRVAPGSVAIGGTYAGIYPAGGPGGWHVVGRTAATLFDPRRDEPCLLMPGDRVRFVPA